MREIKDARPERLRAVIEQLRAERDQLREDRDRLLDEAKELMRERDEAQKAAKHWCDAYTAELWEQVCKGTVNMLLHERDEARALAQKYHAALRALDAIPEDESLPWEKDDE